MVDGYATSASPGGHGRHAAARSVHGISSAPVGSEAKDSQTFCVPARWLRMDWSSAAFLWKSRKLLLATGEAAHYVNAQAKGDIPTARFFPLASAPPSASPSRRTVLFEELVKGWAAERQPVAKTQYEWSRVVRQLGSYSEGRNLSLSLIQRRFDWSLSLRCAFWRGECICCQAHQSRKNVACSYQRPNSNSVEEKINIAGSFTGSLFASLCDRQQSGSTSMNA